MVVEFLPLVAGILSFILGSIVLVTGTNKRSMRWPFGLFAGSVGVWAIFISLFNLTTQPLIARIFVDIYYIAALLIAYGFLIFSLYYSSIRLSRSVVTLALVPWVAMSAVIAVPYWMIGEIRTDAVHSVALVQPGYLVYSIFFIAYALIALIALWHRALKQRRGEGHAAILAVSLTICLSGGGFFNLILPWIGNYQYISIGPLFAFLMVASVFYVITRHGLFDIRLAVIRTVTYVLSLATLAGAYLFVVYVVFNQLLGQSSTVYQTLINVALTLGLAFLFQPVKRFFDRLTNRLFYKDVYNADTFYAKLNKALSSTTDLRTLLKRTATLIAETLKADQAYFVVYGSSRASTIGTEGHGKLAPADARDLAEGGAIAIIDSPRLSPHLHRIMVSAHLGVAMPLKREDEVLGVLCLGEHLTSQFTHRDIRVLRTIADELVIAIQNALSVQEVKDLNAHLEQRIESATRELRASNAQLQRLDEAKDEFISMASHQLRTPLTSIKGYISMLVEGDVGKVTPEQKHLLEEAFISSERMVRLIGDFLNVSRLQTGKFIIEKQPVDLAKVVAQEIDSLGPNASARGLSFVYKQPKKFPELNVDEDKIRQVIMNFADNAIYYSKDNSKIRINLSANDSFVEFTVKDTGIGVPESEKQHLFSKFFRATNARKQRPDGTGVGLFLAKKVIDAHDGQIIFDSKVGRGSTFGFKLPIRKLRV